MSSAVFPFVKLLLSAVVITVVTEAVKRSDRAGALLASLPFVTIISMLWIHHESTAAERLEKVSTHANLVFWYVLPTLPMFLFFPWMARQWGFYGSLAAGAGLTIALFAALKVVAGRFGLML